MTSEFEFETLACCICPLEGREKIVHNIKGLHGFSLGQCSHIVSRFVPAEPKSYDLDYKASLQACEETAAEQSLHADAPTTRSNPLGCHFCKITVFSVNSRDRDWPRFEREITEELEVKIHQPVLIYLCLDDIPVPAHDSSRLAILAANQPLKDVGGAILHALTGIGLQPKPYSYNENEPL